MTSLTLDDRRISVYKIGDREGNDFFREDLVINKLKYRTVGELMTTDTAKGRVERSVVAMLDELKDAEDNQVLPVASAEEIKDDIQELWG